jgi:hypothetical protein
MTIFFLLNYVTFCQTKTVALFEDKKDSLIFSLLVIVQQVNLTLFNLVTLIVHFGSWNTL